MKKDNFIKKYWLTIVGIIVGAAAGALYAHYVGCEDGSCMITSSPIISAIWGGITGGLIFNAFQYKRNEHETKKQNNED